MEKSRQNEWENSSWMSKMESVQKEVNYYKEMYKLAKDTKASRIFILKSLLNPAFETSGIGYLAAQKLEKSKELNEFKMDCANFAR